MLSLISPVVVVVAFSLAQQVDFEAACWGLADRVDVDQKASGYLFLLQWSVEEATRLTALMSKAQAKELIESHALLATNHCRNRRDMHPLFTSRRVGGRRRLREMKNEKTIRGTDSCGCHTKTKRLPPEVDHTVTKSETEQSRIKHPAVVQMSFQREYTQ